MGKSSKAGASHSDFNRQSLLKSTAEIIGLCRANNCGTELKQAKYNFLWYASLADTASLEAAYDLMCEDNGCYDMPIDSNAAFGRILIMAIAPSNPRKAAKVSETLIELYADPGETYFIEHDLLKRKS